MIDVENKAKRHTIPYLKQFYFFMKKETLRQAKQQNRNTKQNKQTKSQQKQKKKKTIKQNDISCKVTKLHLIHMTISFPLRGYCTSNLIFEDCVFYI